MEQSVFKELVKEFRDERWLKDTNNIKVEEQLGIFLLIVGHNARNRVCQDRFQHSGETISRYFRKVLKACLKLSERNIQPPDLSQTPDRILNSSRFYPAFKDCIGALDGTLVHAIIDRDNQVPYRGRKGDCMQNVLAVCSFDMLFTYVMAGWEGTAHDSRILSETIRDPAKLFPLPPPRKYYLVDAGYTNKRGFLAPYRNVRYWLGDYRGRATPQNKEEVFNQLHSSLRNVIERTFGVWKARFPILKRMASYPFDVQVRLIPATMAVHNFIRKKNLHDSLFEQFQSTTVDEDRSTEQLFPQVRPENDQQEMNRVRDEIANLLVSRR